MSYILALAMLLAVGDTAPQLIEPMKDRESCMVEAEKLNKTDVRLQAKEARKLGAEYVCLKIERVMI